ncbi:MAG: division/cell wall cluster transcriptional repressor MraZ [Ruminococcus sp.]|nr:division/cell wall cluster transcriptional repressor MraZ [Ruminococcus sp.]
MDVKGRMTFPAKLREIIGERFIVTRGSDGCLFVYSKEDFELRAEKIRNLPMSQARNFQRVFMANASEVEADKQGRILIPPALRTLAGLDKEIVVTGVSDRCEIWDKQKWEDFNNSVDLGALMDALEGLDF